MGFLPAKLVVPKKKKSGAMGVVHLHHGDDAGGADAIHLNPDGAHGQVIQFKTDPTRFARYQLQQNNREVGWVYVAGKSVNDSVESWQLYNEQVTGTGEAVDGGSAPPRAAYVWPSQDASHTEAKDVTLRMIYAGSTTEVRAPSGLEANVHFNVVKATCS